MFENVDKIKDKLIMLCIICVGIAVLDLFFHPPKNVKNFIRKSLSSQKQKFKKIEIPQVPKLDSYYNVLNNKQIFMRRRKRKKSEEEDLSAPDLGKYIFNGIVKMKGTVYLAIYKKKDKSQYLVPEGQIFGGMKIKKIGENSVTLKFKGGKEKVVPLYSDAPIKD